MQLTREERETFVRTNDATGEWEFFTLSTVWANKAERLGYKLERDHQGGSSCTIPGAFVKIRKPIERRPSGIAALKAREKVTTASSTMVSGS